MPATNDDFADEAQDKDDCDEDDKDYKRKQQQMPKIMEDKHCTMSRCRN